MNEKTAQTPADAPADITDTAQAADVTAKAADDVLDSAAQATSQDTAAGDVLSGDDDAAQEGVPDQYTFDPPEGVDASFIDEGKLDEFKAKAKDLKLSQDQFQNVLSYYIERQQAANQEAVDSWQSRVDGWRQSAKTDKEFGGENYTANVTTALKAVEKFGDAEFKALLKSPSKDNPEGLAIGNHPAVLRFLNRIGKMLGEPNLVQGDASQRATTDEAKLRRMYPTMFKEGA